MPLVRTPRTRVQRLVGKSLVALAWMRSDARLLRDLERSARELRHIGARLPAEEARRLRTWPRIARVEPQSHEWSIYMLLDHLRVVLRNVAEVIDSIAAGWTFSGRARTDYSDPAPSAGRETLEELERAVERLAAVVRRQANGQRRLGADKTYEHPWFGPLTAHEWHLATVVYVHLRLGQARRIYGRR